MRTAFSLVVGSVVLTMVAAQAAIAQQGIPPAHQCPGTEGYESGATVYIGPYATQAEAEADKENAEQEALHQKELAAEAICPDLCSPPNQQFTCTGEADFSDQGSSGTVIAGHNNWYVAVVVDIDSTFTCNCNQ